MAHARQNLCYIQTCQTPEKGLHISTRSNIVGTVWNKVYVLQDIIESTEWSIPDKLAAALAPLGTFKC